MNPLWTLYLALLVTTGSAKARWLSADTVGRQFRRRRYQRWRRCGTCCQAAVAHSVEPLLYMPSSYRPHRPGSLRSLFARMLLSQPATNGTHVAGGWTSGVTHENSTLYMSVVLLEESTTADAEACHTSCVNAKAACLAWAWCPKAETAG